MSGAGTAPDSEVWEGWLTGGDAFLAEINSSVGFDYRLALQDIEGSLAHARMLGENGVITPAEAEQLADGLLRIREEVNSGQFSFDPGLEDVHMNIEARLRELCGPLAGRLHTGRSRNDQVAVDARMWVRSAIDRLDALLAETVAVLAERAQAHHADVMPGFTHLQCAQPVTIGHHLLAYGEMFMRDRDRLHAARRRLDESPLGAAALAGTGYPIDPHDTARRLAFGGVMRNSLDAVSDRDFILDYLSAGATLAVHISRLGEELVLWSTAQFAFISLPEDLCAGSSIMPQKRNPDIPELMRAKSGRVFGSLMSLLTVMKGLPLAYSRDMQEDKEALFDAADTLDVSVRATTAMLRGITFHPQKTRSDAALGNTVATDVADWLVTERGLPFREAHSVVGGLVKWLAALGKELKDSSPAELAEFDQQLADLPPRVLTVENAVVRRRSPGGTAPSLVREAAAELLRRNTAFQMRS
ncbi:argininosuccinate lyase [Streptomyces sp. B-S-A8]|uniref:Argininosuccinate lyase n=1 Tax=Streptomyces solicavernae TaxID=3043614 RepID=A0ABT6S0E9_9ACTN|nr:argininosuccinate lyase [Streptomyces sp. B-S-A8]MDI3389351.1 argininosuccinate lyase [Streptomyces sp. B-S-A8]